VRAPCAPALADHHRGWGAIHTRTHPRTHAHTHTHITHQVDLDLGNYERFLDLTLTRDNNLTTGKVYQAVIEKERRGDYLGKTVQVVPHITDAIQEWIERVAHVPVDGRPGPADVCVIELGGTVGDIESMPFVEALRQFQFRVGPSNFCSVHVSLVPVLGVVGEQKTKPTQHSVSVLRSLGLNPHMLACRSQEPLLDAVREKLVRCCFLWLGPCQGKAARLAVPPPRPGVVAADLPGVHGACLGPGGRRACVVETSHPTPPQNPTTPTPPPPQALFCQVPTKHVLNMHDVSNIWKVPLVLEAQGAHESICAQLQLSGADRMNLAHWKTTLADRWDNLEASLTIAMVGKYTGLSDAYLSVIKALQHACLAVNRRLDLAWVDAEKLEDAAKDEDEASWAAAHATLAAAHGVLVPGGFGSRGVEGKIMAAKYAREAGKPYLGICLGMQLAVVEYARNVLGLSDANSAEFDAATPHPVVVFMPEGSTTHKGGTMRLGSRRTVLETVDCIAAKLYQAEQYVHERHRHRYEVNPTLVPELEAKGLKFVGKDETGQRMEIVELQVSGVAGRQAGEGGGGGLA
jgi:CTP synthase